MHLLYIFYCRSLTVRFSEIHTTEQSTTPIPKNAAYSLRDDDGTIYEPQSDPRFTILAERFFSIKTKYVPSKKIEVRTSKY